MRIISFMLVLVLGLGGGSVAGAAEQSTEEALLAKVASLGEAEQKALLLLINTLGGESAAGVASSVEAALDVFSKAMESGEIDAIMASYSKDFYHPELGGFEELEAYLSNAIDMGYLEDVEVDLEEVELEKEGEELVHVYPITLESPFGALVLELSYALDGGAWKIVSSEASGL